jgi:hypothetical protein
VNDCCKFDWLASKDYKHHLNERCPKCNELRLETHATSRGMRILPRKVFYDLGVRDVIRDKMFTDLTWCQQQVGV